MFKYLFAILFLPFFLLWYMMELCAAVINNTFESIAAGGSIAMKWIDKLPYAA